MAESGGPLSNGGPPVHILQTVDQLIENVTEFQKCIDLELLIPYLLKDNIITDDEQYNLMNKDKSPKVRICLLIATILPRKGENILHQFKKALEGTVKEKGSSGHQELLKKFFNASPKINAGIDADEPHLTAAENISDESEEFSLLMMNFRKILENGTEKAVAQRLNDVADYLCRLRDKKDNSFLLQEDVRAKLDSKDLTFSKLLSCLDSSHPPMVSDNDVSILHKITDKVLEPSEGCTKIVSSLNQLLDKYEHAAGITVAKAEPQISAGSTRVTAKILNANSSGPKLKNGVKKSFWESLKFSFRGSGIGSVVFYWDVPEECTDQLVQSFEDVCHNKIELNQFKITKVEVQLNQKPYQIHLDMEITDPVLLKAVQKKELIADNIAPEQEEFILFLMKIDRLVGNCADVFLSVSRKELSRPYAQFEKKSFKEMTDILIAEHKLHCFDISYIQQFLLSLLKWDTSQGSKHKESIIVLLKEAQDYEPVSTGSSLPALQLHDGLQAAIFTTRFPAICCVSYEVMMALKYALSHLLCLSLSSFQYVSWKEISKGCQIEWKTCLENFEKIEHKLNYHSHTAALAFKDDDFEIVYPRKISFSCIIKNMQIVLDGSPVLYPVFDDFISNVKLDNMLCRVGHVCATCFIEYYWAFRLLWLHCFKPHEHQFSGQVIAVYDSAKRTLCRVRKPTGCVMQKCPVSNCINGRKCNKAHSSIELEFWNLQKSGRNCPMNYKAAVSGSSTVKYFSMRKMRYPIMKNPGYHEITEELSPLNYSKKFHHLLYWEELQHIKELDKRCIDPVDVVICDDITMARGLTMNSQYAMVGYVVMKDADSAKYVTQASQAVRLMLTDRVFIEADTLSLSVRNRINFYSNLNMEHVPIALLDSNAKKFKTYCITYQKDSTKPITNIKACFQLKHHYFQDLHQAVDNVPQVMIHKLFPPISDRKEDLQVQNGCDYSHFLKSPFIPDKLQLKAITSMLSVSSDAPFLLVGPFGTGKTHVLACAAAAIVNEDASAKVLIATHHNKSADTFISKYFGTIESTKSLPPKVAPIRIAAKDLSDDVEKPYFVRFNDSIITKELLDERRIVVTTFNTALHFASTEKVPRGYFTHILIDEGAQTREPETIAPLIFADDRTKVIIAGDHLQVGPKTVVLGEEAVKHGLANSLVERLYIYYDNSDQQCPWIFNLLINYRSHEAIMRLSSNLFYDSVIVSKSNSKLHPHTCYPLHFVCTSLQDGTFQNVNDINCDEADIVLCEVKKYTESWPKQWGKRDKSSVCIVASSRNQVIQLQQKLHTLQINSHFYVEVLPSFDIQGREYRAIFVSTTEATDRNGFCKNPTKSMTDPFVFNTVITRAKSLVVCIGNPYFLCHLEEKMKPGNKCWSTYINHCLDCETFMCLNSNFGQIEKDKLQSILPTSSGRHLINQELSAGDKIIQGYLDSLAQFEERKKVLKFSQNWGDYQWTSYDCDDECYDNEYYYEEDDNDSIPDSQSTCYVTEKCVVDILSRHQALARSVENPNHIIHIRGHKNLRGVFHESTVLVEYSNQQKNEKMVYNGKVVKLLELSSTTFFCEVDHHDSLKFHPINKKDPVFINLPILSKNENGVALFDLQSEGDVPRVVQVFPQQIARKRIFVLKYLYWDHKKYSSPLGIVIDSLSKGYTYSAGEKLLCSQYKFDFFDINCSFKPLKPIQLHQSDKVFTIIEKSNEIIENAFSVQVRDQDTYLINYYVINVASYIEDEMLTDLLKNSGVSAFVKTDKLNAWKLHSMFPPELLRNLNFVLNEPRSCFKLSCLAKIKTAKIEPGKIVETSIEEIVAVPTRTYTLHQVENQLEIQQEFRVLFNIAQCLQLEKLGYSEAGYNCIFDSLETPCVQLILKEFSSWANRLVAMKLVNSSFISFPLHCELPPNAEEKQSVYKDHGDALQTSLHNKYFLPKNGYKLLQDVKINSNALPVLLEALKNEDLFMYLAMLVYDNIFPQLHVASHKFRSIKKTKKIVQCTEASAVDFSISHNHACYTALFTSPLTSSFDILTQGFLSAALNHQPLKYDKEELDSICQKATKDFHRRFDFEDKMFNLQLGVTLKAFNHKVVGYVERVDSKSWLRLSFPSHELRNLDENELSFNIAHLLAFEGFGSNSSATLYEWNVKIASFEGPSSIFTSPDIFLNRLENADAAIDITLFMASSEKEKSQFYAELDKERISGTVKSSTITVNLDEWKKLTKVMYNPAGNCCQDAIKILSSHYKNYSMKRKDLESTKQISEQTVCWSGTVRRKLQKKYDTLHVWLGAAQDATIVYPKIQQVEIAPFLKICVQHNSEPEKCFANASFINASQKCYMNINEYIKLWGQVLMAENAAYSVRTRDIFLLENVYLQWPQLEYCCDSYTGDYYRIPQNEFIIMKPPLSFSKSNIELFDLQRGDLLCVQYDLVEKKLKIHMGFVFHMFVDKISKKHSTVKGSVSSEISEDDGDSMENEKVYYLTVSQSAEKISEKFKSCLESNPKCSIQILHISPPQRRIYKYLHNLDDTHILTQSIACGDTDAIQKAIQDSKFNIEEISSVLSDEKAIHLWKPPFKRLTTNQITLLRKACRSKFLIIHGLPGTGKSTVGVHLAYTFAKLNQITKKKTGSKSEKTRCVVYCSASDSSLDVTAKMLCSFSEYNNKHHSEKLKVLRVYPSNIEQLEYPNPFELLHDSEAASESENLDLKGLKRHSLHYKIRFECGDLGETIKTYEKSFNTNKQRQKFASKADRVQYKKVKMKAESKILSDSIDILICNCKEMASARIFHNIEVAQVIIDEAAMVTEPESIIPVQYAEQIILIGDHHELQPKVYSKHAERSGLNTSLFQRYVDVIQFEHSILKEQFRMHKIICEFSANQFYEEMGLFTNQIAAKEMEIKAKKLKTLWPNHDPLMPFVFCDLVGTEKIADAQFIDKIRVGQESLYNPEEANKIIEIAKVLVMNYGVKEKEILVLSPYQAQRKHMRDKLNASRLKNVKCKTVKSCEGSECGIVLLSTVRSLPLADIKALKLPDRAWMYENLGFLIDKHIINVGVTRCQYGLVIVGNKHLLEYDETWNNLIRHCSKYGSVVSEKQFPPRADIEKIRGFSMKS